MRSDGLGDGFDRLIFNSFSYECVSKYDFTRKYDGNERDLDESIRRGVLLKGGWTPQELLREVEGAAFSDWGHSITCNQCYSKTRKILITCLPCRELSACLLLQGHTPPGPSRRGGALRAAAYVLPSYHQT